jgi:hypothetical protein
MISSRAVAGGVGMCNPPEKIILYKRNKMFE